MRTKSFKVVITQVFSVSFWVLYFSVFCFFVQVMQHKIVSIDNIDVKITCALAVASLFLLSLQYFCGQLVFICRVQVMQQCFLFSFPFIFSYLGNYFCMQSKASG